MEDMYVASDEERYNFLIQTVARNKTIWLLQERDGMFAMMEDANGQEYIPVWPTREYALKNMGDDWEGYQAEPMDLFEFNSWLKELEDDAVMIAAFPNDSDKIIPVQAVVLKRIFEDEYKRINADNE